MRQLKLVFIILSIVILLGIITYLGWIIYLSFRKPAESPLKAIPENTALIIKLNKPTVIWQDISRGNLIWKELTVIPYFASLNRELRTIDSLLMTSKQLYRIAQTSPLYAAMILTGRSSYSFLFLASIPGTNGENEVTSLLRESYGEKLSIITNQYGASNLVRVTFAGQKEPFYFAVRSGVFMGSRHPEIIRKAIDQLSLNISSVENTGFARVEPITGKKVDANFYINYRLCSPFVAGLLQPDAASGLTRISRFADWSGLDLILKKDELLINGYTTVNDTANQYLRIFSKQAPQKVSITNILPDNTSRFIWFGFSEIEKYYRSFLSYSMRNESYVETSGSVVTFQNENQVDVRDYILPWIGNEICVSTSLVNPGTPREDAYAVMKSKDHLLADSLLSALRSMTAAKKRDSLHYKKHPIYNLELQDLLPSVFGKPFRGINSSYYTAIGDYIIFGNSSLALKNFIDHVEYNKVMANDKAFLSLADYASDITNLYYYFNTERESANLRTLFSDDLSQQLQPVLDTLKKFESVTLQFTSKDGLFYTNLYVHYNPVTESKAPVKWQVKLDTLLLQVPQIVPAGNNHENVALAFDVSNMLYRIDSTGKISWKLQSPGKPLSPVSVVHRQPAINFYLFNTDRMLCMVDDSGKFVQGFPHPLPLKAAGELTLTNNSVKGNYRILIPLADNRVHEFDLDGMPVRGWGNPGMAEGLSHPVQVLENGKKEFIFIRGKNGHLLVTDRKGKPILKPGKEFTTSRSNNFYLNQTNKKGIFLTSDPYGKIIYLKESWKSTEMTLNLFSPSHLFFYEDINNDGKYEYIFYDKGRIYIYDRFYRLIFNYSFRREITIPPYLIPLPDGKYWIGAVSAPANELYLFGKEGMVEMEPGISGNEAFTVGSFGKEGQWDLVAGSGKILRCYRLTK